MEQMSSTKITIIFPTNAYFMSGIRDFTFSMIKNMTEFPEKWAYRFQSVVDELCNNAIEHGSKSMEEVKIVFCYFPKEAIEIVVEDSGTGASRMKAADLQKYVAERKNPRFPFTELRGRGLSKIVAEWTDELDFHDRPEGGVRVRVKKYLKNPEMENADAPLSSKDRILLTV